ncbi:unnamed protein product [Porites evermanni]|uniref:Uncharacterized protein n=1 Tax=Porites evermanni TaxID=104178 RepID=A0ABN8M8Q6_9CNID|nr:unnamed protein product [Porites evermanni]
MFPKAKRFQDTVSQAPPVGSYEIKTQRHGTAPGFGKGKRFAELKDTGPGPVANSSLLDASTCSNSSQNGTKCSGFEFATPLPFRKSRKMSSSTPNPKEDQSALENEISRLLSERTELENRLCGAQQQVQDQEKKFQSLLQEKTCHKSTIADLQKEVQVLTEEKDQILVKLQAHSAASSKLETLEEELQTVKSQLLCKEGVISTLKMQVSCAAENSRADLELEQEKNKALTERISSLGYTYYQYIKPFKPQCPHINSSALPAFSSRINSTSSLNPEGGGGEGTVSKVTSNIDEVEEANQKLY